MYTVKVAHIYVSVSTNDQDLTHQAEIERSTRAAGYLIAGIYREKASDTKTDRSELIRLVNDLQPGEVVIAEKIYIINHLPLVVAEKLVVSIREKGAKLIVPGLVDLSELASQSDIIVKRVLEAVQELLLKVVLQIANDGYENRQERQLQGIALAKAVNKYRGRKPELLIHERIIKFRSADHSIKQTAELSGCSESQVKLIWAKHKTNSQTVR